MRHIISLVTVCGFLCYFGLAVAQQPQETNRAPAQIADAQIADAQAPSHMLTLKLYEKHGDSRKVLANPTIETHDQRPFSFFAGGEITTVVPTLEYGTRVDGTIETISNERLKIAMRVSHGNPIKVDDPDIIATQSRSIDVRMNLVRSATKTIQIDAVTWLDICVE